MIAAATALAVALPAVPSEAQTRATLRAAGRVRDQADTKARILATLAPGTMVTVLAQTKEWMRVRAPDGTTGWLWTGVVRPLERTAEPPRERAPASLPATPPMLATAIVAPETREADLAALRAEVEALRRQQPAVSPAEIEALRAEVRALAAAQRDLERRLHVDLPLSPSDAGTPPETAPGSIEAQRGTGRSVLLAVLLLLLAVLIGWTGSRLVFVRRERRQRLRF